MWQSVRSSGPSRDTAVYPDRWMDIIYISKMTLEALPETLGLAYDIDMVPSAIIALLNKPANVNMNEDNRNLWAWQ